MSLSGLLLRFTGIYVALIVGLAVLFALLGTKANSGVNVGALVGAVFAACMWFANKNKRYLAPSEKRTAFFGMWAIDILLQVLMAFTVGAASGTKLPLEPMLFALGFVGLLHGIAIYFMVALAGKQYARQVAKGA